MKKQVCVALGALFAGLVGLVGCASPETGVHSHDWVAEKTVSPTCIEEGYTQYVCSSCGQKMCSDYVSALTEGGHRYRDCVCIDCGDFLVEEATDTETLTYVKTRDDDGNVIYEVTGISEESAYIKIPSTHNGAPVTRIGKKAFWNVLSLQHVILPDSITYIGEAAFKYCMNLKSIAIPDSVTEIGKEAFWDCQRLNAMTIPDLSSIPSYLFIGCESVTEFEIPQGVTEIGVHSFSDCYSLTSVTIPASVETICHAAFWKCRNLQDIYFEGTTQQWNAIFKEVGEYSNTGEDASWNAYTGEYVVHCSDGQIAKA